MAAYAFAALGGLALYNLAPPSISETGWDIVNFVASWLLVVGGVIAAVASSVHEFRIEYVAVIGISTTVSTYAITLWLLAIIDQRHDVIFTACLVTCLFLMNIARYAELSRLVKAREINTMGG